MAAVASAGIAVAVGLALAVSSTTLAIAAPAAGATAGAARADYPSWADVQAAKSSQAATQAEVTKIQSSLGSLQKQADALSKTAEIKAEESNQANVALAAATAKTAKLQSQADTAQAKARTSSKRAAALIAQLAQTGGGDMSLGVLLGSAKKTDRFLASLGTASRLSESTEGILRQAQFDKNNATSLAAGATAAEKKQKTLAAAADSASDAAKKAVASIEAQLAATQTTSQTMYAQLASLQNTTASIEQQRADGLAEEARQNAVKIPPSAPIINPTPPAPVADAVAGAIAYAKAQLGDAYQLNGAGPNVWDCSGLTLRSYQSVGVNIGTHSATNQYATLKASGRIVNLSQVQAGDLLFYTETKGSVMYHVAIALGGGQMIEAPMYGTPVRIASIRYGDLWPYVGRPTA